MVEAEMARVLLVACSGGEPKLNQNLSDAIKESGEKWWHYLDSVWLIKTDKSANDVGKELSAIVKADPKRANLLVVEVRGFAQGWLSSKAWEWINTHVPRN